MNKILNKKIYKNQLVIMSVTWLAVYVCVIILQVKCKCTQGGVFGVISLISLSRNRSVGPNSARNKKKY